MSAVQVEVGNMAGFPDKPMAHLLGSNGPIHAVAYSAPPSTYILTGSSDRAIRLYNPFPTTPTPTTTPSSTITKRPSPPPPLPQGRLIQTYTAHAYEVLSLAITADNARFASAGGDRAVHLWDVAAATTLRRFGAHGPPGAGHKGRINAVAFWGEGDALVVSGGFDTTVRVWDARSGSPRPVQVLAGARDAVAALAVRGAEVLAGSVDGRVRAYDARVGRVVVDVLGAPVTALTLARDGRSVLVGTLDSRVRLMDREAGTCLRTYEARGRWRNEDLRVQSVLGGKERWVVAGDERTAPEDGGGDEGRVWAWDLLSGEVVATVPVPWGPEGAAGKRVVGRDGKEKERKSVVSCLAWKEAGWGDQFCVGGSSGVVTVFGQG